MSLDLDEHALRALTDTCTGLATDLLSFAKRKKRLIVETEVLLLADEALFLLLDLKAAAGTGPDDLPSQLHKRIHAARLPTYNTRIEDPSAPSVWKSPAEIATHMEEALTAGINGAWTPLLVLHQRLCLESGPKWNKEPADPPSVDSLGASAIRVRDLRLDTAHPPAWISEELAVIDDAVKEWLLEPPTTTVSMITLLGNIRIDAVIRGVRSALDGRATGQGLPPARAIAERIAQLKPWARMQQRPAR